MPAPYGVTETGFNIPTLEEIKTEIETLARAIISPAFDMSTETPLGQFVGIIASMRREDWEAMQAAYNANFPSLASGRSLTEIAAITDTYRRAATKSVVQATVNVDPGTYAIGTLTAHVAGNPAARFVNTEAVNNGGGSAASITGIEFTAVETGRVVANAGTLTVIAETVDGWNSITNPLDGTIGAVVESDPLLRARRTREVMKQSGSSTSTLEAAVSALTGMQAVRVYENEENYPVDGRPAKSVEVVAYDGTNDGSGVSDSAIAQTIWERKAAAIKTYGNDSGSATDLAGNARTIYFSRPTVIDVYVTLRVFVSRTQFDFDTGKSDLRLAIAEYGDANFTLGENVFAAELIAEALRFPGVTNARITLGRSSGDQTTDDLEMSERELPAFDTGRITVLITEYTA